jgi:hypothetical protein
MVTLCAEPGAFERTAVEPFARTGEEGLGVVAGRALRASERRLIVDLGPGARLAATLAEPRGWPRRAAGALGPAHWVPGLGQYWTPHLLGAEVTGAVELDGRRLDLAGAHAYGEKNWGAAFARHWWWGQASFDAGSGVAFAGGRLRRLGLSLAPTAVAVWTPEALVSLAPPLARTVASASGNRWRVRAATPRTVVELEGEATGPPLRLPVPVVAERRLEKRSEHHLAAHLALTVRRGRRVWMRAETGLAALEHGRPEASGVSPESPPERPGWRV